MTAIEIAWLAGILEGEGCFGLGSSKSPTIWLTMTDEDIISRAADLCCVGYSQRKSGRKDRKPAYSMWVCGQQSLWVMRQILPHMGLRRASKINEVIAIVNARPARRAGERVGTAKLSNEQAANILVRWKANPVRGIQSALAREYGVSSQAIGHLVRRKYWKSLEVAL